MRGIGVFAGLDDSKALSLDLNRNGLAFVENHVKMYLGVLAQSCLKQQVVYPDEAAHGQEEISPSACEN
jgi:hypothetical protein